MADKDAFQRYLDAGVAFTNMTRARAEQLVQDLVSSGEFSSGDTRAKVDELIERSREMRELFVSQVRREVDHQLEVMGFTGLEDLARQVASMLQRTADVGRASTGRTKAAAKKRPAKKGAGKKAAAKKGAAKKAGAKKSGVKKAAAKKASPKKRLCQEEPGKEGGGHQGGAHRPEARAPPGTDRLTRPARRRLDRALVERGLATSRARAVELVETGRVTVSGAVADRPSRLVSPAEPIELLEPPARFVSRGGEKLAAALERFALDLRGARALDVGASTGGFTDCLLQAGAVSVAAVDVGRGQLHQRLRHDERVDLHEGVDVREVTVDLVGGSPVDLVTADLSFISLRLAVPALTGGVAVPGAPLVLLVKPRIRGRPGRGVPREGCDPRPCRSPSHPLRSGRHARRRRSSHHGGHALAPHRTGRERRVLPPRPDPDRRGRNAHRLVRVDARRGRRRGTRPVRSALP